MLDIKDFVAERGGSPDRIRESQRRRFEPVEIVDEIIKQYQDHRKAQYDVSQLNTRINAVQKQIGLKKKAKGDASDLLKEKLGLEAQKKAREVDAVGLHTELQVLLKTVGNYVAEGVPVSQTEDHNEVDRTWAPEGFNEAKAALSHHEVLSRLDGYDPVRGVKLAGHRGYCLTNYGVLLNQALINYGLDFLHGKGSTLVQPPYFLNKQMMAKTAQLSQFDEELYHVSEGAKGETDSYLIATSEQPLSAMFSGEWLTNNDLPKRLGGYSTCFRKEAGSGGRDTWGLFRIHQFEKVEQFVLCKPEDSWKHFDELMANSEEFFQSLKIPYRVVSIVSGALNNAASRKQDLEAWFPNQQAYKELVSCSNCTDYQSRPLEIRYGYKKQKEEADAKKEYVHALNSTLCATERTLCCILENYQDENGIRVPEVLRRFIPGQPERIDYVKALEQTTLPDRAKEKGKK